MATCVVRTRESAQYRSRRVVPARPEARHRAAVILDGEQGRDPFTKREVAIDVLVSACPARDIDVNHRGHRDEGGLGDVVPPGHDGQHHGQITQRWLQLFKRPRLPARA
jgi:hypothetical protein